MDLPNYAYFQGSIVPYEQAKVGVLTHALNYGTAVFGGMRAYWNPEQQQLYLFRPQDHFRRFLNSARLMRMSFDHSPESLTEVARQLVLKEGYRRDIYLRPLAYKADEIIGVKLHGLKDELSIVSIPFDLYVSNDTNAHVTVSSWRRVDDNMIPARGKISGAYANSAFVKSDALLAGFDEALVLNSGRPRLRRQRDEHLHAAGWGAGHAAGDGEYPGGHHPADCDRAGQPGDRPAGG